MNSEVLSIPMNGKRKEIRIPANPYQGSRASGVASAGSGTRLSQTR